MFSEECFVQMIDGTKKQIKSLNINNFILNKSNKPTKIKHIVKTISNDYIKIQLDNQKEPFYTSHDTKFLCHFYQNNQHFSYFASITDVIKYDAFLKSSDKIFSPQSDVKIISYEFIKNSEKTFYTLYTSDNTKGFFLNNIIVTSIYD